MKSIAIYLLLVGIPVSGVIGVLSAGRRIVPPASVGGTWQLAMVADSLCHSAAQTDSVVMTVSQSGPHISVTIQTSPEVTLAGRLDGTELQASGPDRVQLSATVPREENRIRGSLVGVPCAAARNTLFQGARDSAGVGDGH